MKKYQQLLLLILSVISLVSLLFYRHEYNKLRYVLEVLNFFGTPGISSSTSCTNQTGLRTEHNLKLLEPLPSWQRIGNSLFIYSAFWETVEDKSQVQAIALGTLNENLNYGCYLWFEELEDPVRGQFSFTTLAKRQGRSKKATQQSKTKAYIFICEPGQDYSTPFGVSFYKLNDESNLPFIPVLNVYENHPIANTTGICILPVDVLEIPRSSILEFISYHHVIGVNHFILYGVKYFHSVLSPLLKDPQYNVDLTVLQWNYPFINDYDLINTIVETDCILRSKGIFESVLVLHWNQYIIPKYHSNLSGLITDLDATKKLAKFQVSSYLFCLEYNDDPKSDNSLPLSLRKTRYTIPKVEFPITINHPHLKIPTNAPHVKASTEIVVVNWYTKCGPFDLVVPEKTKNYKYDYAIFKFNSEFLRSKILKAPTY